jgi:hypothetical protein
MQCTNRNWAFEVRKILISVCQNQVWETETINIEYNVFLSNLQRVLVDLYIQDWHITMLNQNKLMSYRLYKSIFCQEMYLSTVKNTRFRMALSRLRLSAHSLAIEIGRYPPRIPRERRFCQYCALQDIGDEYHIVMFSLFHQELRSKYLPLYYRQRPSVAKCVQLMRSDYVLLINNVAKFVYYANKQR